MDILLLASRGQVRMFLGRLPYNLGNNPELSKNKTPTRVKFSKSEENQTNDLLLLVVQLISSGVRHSFNGTNRF